MYRVWTTVVISDQYYLNVQLIELGPAAMDGLAFILFFMGMILVGGDLEGACR